MMTLNVDLDISKVNDLTFLERIKWGMYDDDAKRILFGWELDTRHKNRSYPLPGWNYYRYYFRGLLYGGPAEIGLHNYGYILRKLHSVSVKFSLPLAVPKDKVIEDLTAMLGKPYEGLHYEVPESEEQLFWMNAGSGLWLRIRQKDGDDIAPHEVIVEYEDRTSKHAHLGHEVSYYLGIYSYDTVFR